PYEHGSSGPSSCRRHRRTPLISGRRREHAPGRKAGGARTPDAKGATPGRRWETNGRQPSSSHPEQHPTNPEQRKSPNEVRAGQPTTPQIRAHPTKLLGRRGGSSEGSGHSIPAQAPVHGEAQVNSPLPTMLRKVSPTPNEEMGESWEINSPPASSAVSAAPTRPGCPPRRRSTPTASAGRSR